MKELMKNGKLSGKRGFGKLAGKLQRFFNLKKRVRQTVSAFLVLTMLFGAFVFDIEMFKAWAQTGCGGADKIFQNCALGGGQVENDLTNQAVDDVIEMYKLRITDRTLVLQTMRNEVRGMLYIRLLALINKPDKTTAEAQAIETFAGKIKDSRVRAAVAARDEYHRWQQNPCGGYQPPAPNTYNSPGCTFYTLILNGEPIPPTFEEFQQYGAAAAHGAAFSDDSKVVAERTGQAVQTAASLGVITAGTGIGLVVGQSLTFSALSSVLPFAASSWGTWGPNLGQIGVVARNASLGLVKTALPSTASSGASGGAAIGGPIAVIAMAIQILATQTVNVVNRAQLPDKLDQAIVDMQNANINVRDLLTTDAGNSEVYMNFIFQTLPDFPAPDAPAAQPTDRKFVVYNQTTGQQYETPTLNARLEWENNRYLQLRLTGGLFAHPAQSGAESPTNPSRQTVAIRYLDWDNKIKMAYRTGLAFYIIDPTNTQKAVLDGEIKLKVDNQNVVVRIKDTEMQTQEVGTKIISCGSIVNPGQGADTIIGKVEDAGEPASTLSATINGGASATVNGITIRNLHINNDYEVIGNVLSENAPTPTIANFTGTVANSVGQTKTFSVELKKTAVVNSLPAETIRRLTLGDYYEAIVGSELEISCSANQFTVSGDLPPGLKIGRPAGNATPNIYLYGTPASAGKYHFNLTKQYANGESISQDYIINISADMIRMDDSATSWWRAESGAADHFKRADGTVVGNVVFEKGKVNRGFYFDGSDSYIRLPENTFSPGNDFTFETWFKTDRAGVIVGSQPIADPYGDASGATPLIYVSHDGKLQVQMFRDQYNRSIRTEQSVNDNQYHHVAVTYSAADQMRRVYLDGEEVSSLFGGQLASSTKYQFGTGYAPDAVNGGTNGWLNFKGVIDEPTVYSRALSLQDIRNIYAVGGLGKLYLKIRPYAPQVRDGNDGGLLMEAQGGFPLRFKLRWQNPLIMTAEQDTSYFMNLRPTNYEITVVDELENQYVTSAIVPNAPANISVTTVAEQPRCSGAANGSIRVLINGGNSIPFNTNYQYSILGGAVRQDSNFFPDLLPQTYTPRVHDTDTNTDYEGQPVTLAGPAPFALSPSAFANAQQNVAYSQTFTLSGNTAPYTFRAEGNDINNNYDLPVGLTATVAPNQITISGTPTASGTFPIRILYTDRNGCQGSTTKNLSVVAAGNVSVGGRVTNGGQGLPNATVILSGGANQTATTDPSGNYLFTNLPQNQNYTATVSLSGYSFAQPTLNLNDVGANVSNADFPTAFTHYEGDIAPRATGDGSVDVRDFILLTRIINNQEAQPASGGEWQRASIAPRSTLGSNILQSADVTQMLRYIVRTNPLTLVGGPTASSAPVSQNKITLSSDISTESASKTESPDNLTTATVSAPVINYTGGAVQVPISLTSDGTATAAQFTINYDNTKLFLNSVSNGDANNLYSVNSTVSGKVNVVAFRNGFGNFPIGTTALLRLNFSVIQGATGHAIIDFTDAPTQRLATDANANTITLNSSQGRVLITGPTAAGVSVGGRVISPTGIAVNRARILVTMPNGEVRTAITNAFGYYQFDEIEVGETYVFTVEHKQYTFNPQVLNITDAVENLDFTALGEM